MRDARTMGRPREFDAQNAIAQIMDVFWRNGFEGTSMSDLVDATGLKKGSLYAAFGNKRSMYLKALLHYDRTEVDASVHLLTSSESADKRIAKFLQVPIDAVADRKDRRGCFLCTASVDQAALDLETERIVNVGLKRMERALAGALAEVDNIRLNKKELSGRASHLLSVYLGMRVLAKAGYPLPALRAIKRSALLDAGLPP
ncbi:MAG: TetR/AcrR family transcriptional regulator [Methyloligellaceae bacterium]